MATSSTQHNLSQQVVRHIYKQIQDGALKTGDKLPTNRALAEKLEVSILTVQRSMKQLEAQGTVTCHRRTGTFLTDPKSITSPKIQSGLIGLFVPGFFSDFHTDLLLELEEGMMEEGKLVSINFTRSDPERELTLLRTLARQRLEALVYLPSPRVVGSESHSKTISSWINRYIEEGTQILFADLCPKGFESRLVSLDDSRAGSMLTTKLIEHGHTNIAFLGSTHLASVAQRLSGHYKALKKAGLPINEDWHLDIQILQGKNWIERMEHSIREMLSLYPEITGFVISDQTTAETLYKILNELPDRKIPAEQSIAALFETPTPPFEALAWMHIPGKRMGKKICQILQENHSADHEPGHIKIRPTFWKG